VAGAHGGSLEHDAREVAALRGRRFRKSEEEIARYQAGNWREEPLFILGLALELDDTQQQIAAYEQGLGDEIRAYELQFRQGRIKGMQMR